MEDDDKDNTPTGIVLEAKERFQLAKSAYSKSRQQAVDDTKFAMGDSDNGWQWPSEVTTARKGDRRVCLTVNLTAQHCNNIINQIRQNRPTGRVMPADDYADKKTAKILEGLIRNIQQSSSSDDAHDIAAEHAIYGGSGYWRIITEYESPESFNQVIKIKPCHNPQLVYIDPNAVEVDKSDAEWGFIFEDIKKETFYRENPDIKEASDWELDKERQWVTGETIRSAEYFWCEYVPDNALLLENGETMLESNFKRDGVTRDGMSLTHTDSSEKIKITKERKTERKQWKWAKLVGGHDTPVDQKDWAGSYLPIVSVVGKEINVNGEILVKGIVRDLKDPARMVNYAFSETVQTLALQNKVPYIASAESLEGYENIWGAANIDNAAYLPYNAYDDEGNLLQPPQRQPPPVMPSAQIQLLQLSTEEMRGASGQQNSNFGIKSEASSGIGIQRLKQQGEIATFHFPDNLARGLRYEIKLLLDLIPKVLDTKQIVRVLGLDGKLETATLDPEHPQAYSEQDIGEEDIKRVFNPTMGLYDAVIDTGPSFQTQRQEAYASMMDLAGKIPELMHIAGDVIMRNADYPGSEQIADRIAKALPPNMQDQKGGAEQQLQQMSGQMQQAQQQMQMLQQQLQEAQGKLQQAETGQAKAQMEIEAKMHMAGIDQQLLDRKMQLEASAKLESARLEYQFKQELAALDAQIEEAKSARELAAKLHLVEMEAKIKREQSGIDVAGDIAKSHQDNMMKMQMNADNNETKEDIAELDAYVKLEIAGQQNEILKADVQQDLIEDDKDS